MKKFVPIIVGLVVVLGGAVAASQFGYVSIPGSSRGEKPRVSAPEQGEMGPTIKLNPLIINLKEENGRSYLKSTTVLEVSRKEEVEEVNKAMPLITDLIILTLGEKRLEDLKEPDSKEKLKQELVTKMNQYFPSKPIKRIYFDEFLYE